MLPCPVLKRDLLAYHPGQCQSNVPSKKRIFGVQCSENSYRKKPTLPVAKALEENHGVAVDVHRLVVAVTDEDLRRHPVAGASSSGHLSPAGIWSLEGTKSASSKVKHILREAHDNKSRQMSLRASMIL